MTGGEAGITQHQSGTRSCEHCGAESGATDYCDSCGAWLGPSQQTIAADDPIPASSATRARCPACGEGQAPGDDFCEACGRSFTAGAEATVPDQVPDPGIQPMAGWTAVVEADQAFFEANRTAVPDGLTFPAGLAAREVPLRGDEIVIGRRNEAKGFFPDIDLSTPVTDPAVSRLHAVLSRQPDGSWALVDRGSVNGTWINGATVPVEAMVPTPLHDGDRVHLGAFSVLRMRRNDEVGR